jgi:hypothetical protein
MQFRFDELKKLPPDPAARLLSMKSIKLETQVKAPASAPVPVVLQELQDEGAPFDIMRLLAVALPPREAVWWACLSARDIVGHEAKQVPRPLAMAEQWVFKPNEENREAARIAMETADMDDDTIYCAMAAAYADGLITPDVAAPPNAVPAAVMSMNIIALGVHAKVFEEHTELLIARGLDIARGGSGRVKVADMQTEKGDA